MVEYRHNQDWDTMFFRSIEPENLKSSISLKAAEENLGDIEVIDTQINSSMPYGNAKYRVYDILVFYRKIPKKVNKSVPSEVTVKD